MNRLCRLFQRPALHAALLVFSLILFSRPFFASAEARMPEPLFYYLFAAWGVVVALLLLVSVSLRHGTTGAGEPVKGERDTDV